MITIEEEAEELINAFGDLATKVVEVIIPECYEGSLPFWKKVHAEIQIQQSDNKKNKE